LHSWHAIGHKQNEGNILGRLGNLIVKQRGNYAKAQLYARQALRLAQNSYPAAQVQAVQALHLSREIGYQYYEAGCLMQLGSIANELGEYVSALEYHTQALSILRKMGAQDVTCQILTALSLLFYHWGQPETALENSREALSIAQETKNKLSQTRALTALSHVFRELGDLDEAAGAYYQASALAQGNPAKAQAPMDEILDYLQTHSLSTMDESLWIYLTCYRILQANHDPRARHAASRLYPAANHRRRDRRRDLARFVPAKCALQPRDCRGLGERKDFRSLDPHAGASDFGSLMG
jgi:tetratricopeptide (TPR) repeat protein